MSSASFLTDRIRAFGSAIRRFSAQRHEPTAPAVMREAEIDPASHEIDALFQCSFAEGARIVGLIGVETGDGVTTLARALSCRCARTNIRTVMVDVSGQQSRDGPRAERVGTKDGYDILTIRPDTGDLYQTRTRAFLRKMFTETLVDYDAIIVKCSPAVARPLDTVPGYVTASCVDACLLVCMGGKTTRGSVDHARRALTGVPLRGVVVNARDQPTLGEELAREVMRLSGVLPLLSKSIADRALKSKLLDLRT